MCAVRRVDVRQREYQRESDRYSVQVTLGGKPVANIKPERITSVQEEVMTWQNADHIHGWFVSNVQYGKDDGREYCVSKWELRKLLAVCEKVLNGSHLVREPEFKEDDYDGIRQRMNASGKPSKVIKNVSVAQKLLPYRDGYRDGYQRVYGEAYLKDVEATRDWAERMLIDSESDVPGAIYYSGS